MSLRTWKDAVVVITGGASGFGRAFAETLAKRGANLILADVQRDALTETVLAIEKAGGKARGVMLDVRKKKDVEDFIENAWGLEKRLDYVFANAGIGVFGETHLLEDKEWDDVLDINVWGVVHTVRPAYRKMVAQGFGHIVSTASLAGLVHAPFLAPYALSKHAVVGMTKTLRIEAGGKGVRVSALCPGAVRTPILHGGKHGGSIYPKMTPERALQWWGKVSPIMELADFTREALAAVEKNEGIIILPNRNKTLNKLANVFPRAAEKAAERLYFGTLRDFPEIKSGRG